MPRTLSTERKQFLADVFTTAIESGIGYWAEVLKYRWSFGAPDFDQDLDGYVAEIRDEAGKRHTITRATIQRGLGVITRATEEQKIGLHRTYRDQIRNASHENDACDMDAELSDAVVQAGLFGQIVYG